MGVKNALEVAFKSTTKWVDKRTRKTHAVWNSDNWHNDGLKKYCKKRERRALKKNRFFRQVVENLFPGKHTMANLYQDVMKLYPKKFIKESEGYNYPDLEFTKDMECVEEYYAWEYGIQSPWWDGNKSDIGGADNF